MTSQLEETLKPRTREAQSTDDFASDDVISTRHDMRGLTLCTYRLVSTQGGFFVDVAATGPLEPDHLFPCGARTHILACPTCHGELWICEAHPDQSWPHCEAVGVPCLCNPRAAMPSDFTIVAESETFRRMQRADAGDKTL